MIPPKARSSLLAAVLLVAGCGGADYLTVAEARAQADELDGRQIRIRGWASRTMVFTLVDDRTVRAPARARRAA